jgi:hypothetical protein
MEKDSKGEVVCTYRFFDEIEKKFIWKGYVYIKPNKTLGHQKSPTQHWFHNKQQWVEAFEKCVDAHHLKD